MRKRKPPELKVATVETTYHSDGSSTETGKIVSLADLPSPKPVAIYTGTDELIEKHQNDDWIKDRALLQELRIAKWAHVVFGEGAANAVIRVELLDIIEALLVERLSAQRCGTAGKKKKARPKQDMWKAAAAQIRLAHPKFSDNDSWIAERIAERHGGNPNWIRRVISRK